MIGNILALTNSTPNENIGEDGLLKKGLYNGNASDLKAEIDKKVSQEAGKGLSSNDYTNEEKQKNEENANKRIVGFTVTGDVNKIITITFADSTVMQAPFNDNDHIPLADVNMNSLNFNENTGVLTGVKSDGNEISVSLDGRYSLIGHNHDEQYSPKIHTHSEYAYRTHRHNKDDIDGLPANIATTDNVKTAIDRIQIGGRNLLIDSNNFVIFWNYSKATHKGSTFVTPRGSQYKNEATKITFDSQDWNMFQKINFDEYGSYVLSGWVKLETATNLLVVVNNTYSASGIFGKSVITGSGWQKFVIPLNVTGNLQAHVHLGGYATLPTGEVQSNGDVLLWNFKLEKGNVVTDWSPAPEDIIPVTRAGASISSNWVATQGWQNRVIFVESSLNIELNNLEEFSSISFIKIFNEGNITFSCGSKNIVLTGDQEFNGKDGSTAKAIIAGHKCYIQISNVN